MDREVAQFKYPPNRDDRQERRAEETTPDGHSVRAL
jgi:hypothetical protein